MNVILIALQGAVDVKGSLGSCFRLKGIAIAKNKGIQTL
jgi:hypothetical protein